MLNYNNSNKWNEALGYENVGKYYKLESIEWNQRQTCIQSGVCVEAKAQLVPPPDYITRASVSLGKVSRAGITHFYLSSLLQSLFHFYVSLKLLFGAWFCVLFVVAGHLWYAWEYWKWVITNMPVSTTLATSPPMLIRVEHLVCLLYFICRVIQQRFFFFLLHFFHTGPRRDEMRAFGVLRRFFFFILITPARLDSL